MNAPLLQVENLQTYFGDRRWPIRAVDGVSLAIERGETLGLVGESGCGKTTFVRTLLRLEQASGGQALLDGIDIARADRRQLRAVRRKLQVVFQDPYQSFNPRMRVDAILDEPWLLHPDVLPRSERPARMARLLTDVGLRPEHALRYPNELSGGQRQRLGIARALALEPELLVCDEPVSALDVSVQAQVINLLVRLKRQRNLAMLFVAHNLAVVRHVSDRVAVMYLGKVIETGPTEALFRAAAHPYTQALLSAVPVPDPKLRGRRKRIVLQGDLPSPVKPPSGCRFRTRCWKATELCASVAPELRPSGPSGLLTACHHPSPGGDTAKPAPSAVDIAG
jgi:oligopeptide transport system ATP-binding protein